MTPDPLLRPLESLLNRNIAASAQATEIAGSLDGRSFEVRLAPMPFRIRLTAGAGRIAVTAGGELPADASIEGTPLSLAALAAPGGEERIRGGGLRIEGDVDVAQRFQKLLTAARPDLEEELSRLTGDAIAHHAANFARQAFGFARQSVDTFAQNVGEYLTEESRDLPARSEVEQFLADVDRLREDADRLEARLAVIESRLRSAAP
ncbi:MAG: SCP2 sterol-binding domain-containing protein [Gammaproteobacteria bacterium]|nr:SCP2 sterol-binding domain-containing protein [Gammaproteobacteria bacterium]